ncbi:MAG: thermonuclease family protein [Candidatus Nitrosocosmicus sp.]|nr:thermonuclease family protein [Candidatus Nitrosocosmicus sp.]MDN5867464.1 thermonuclease family protein [Candidatus Nitrosocosmicus sp.]
MRHFLFYERIFVFLVFLGTITFSNQVWATLNSDLVTTSSNFSGTVTKVIDGDTLDIKTAEGETITVRLVLIDAPEKEESGFDEARNFITEQCLNKNAEVDPDNNQGLTYGRTVAVVYCEGVNVNEAILDNGFADVYQDFCDVSEFADSNWAEHGCLSNGSNNNDNDDNVDSGGINNNQFDNDGKDLDCKDFDEKNIPVGNNDPHNLDGDGDGIGCEG